MSHLTCLWSDCCKHDKWVIEQRIAPTHSLKILRTNDSVAFCGLQSQGTQYRHDTTFATSALCHLGLSAATLTRFGSRISFQFVSVSVLRLPQVLHNLGSCENCWGIYMNILESLHTFPQLRKLMAIWEIRLTLQRNISCWKPTFLASVVLVTMRYNSCSHSVCIYGILWPCDPSLIHLSHLATSPDSVVLRLTVLCIAVVLMCCAVN